MRGQVFWGGAPHLKYKQSMEPQVDGSVLVRQDVEGFQHAPDGPYLILMTRTEGPDTPIAEEGVRSRLRSVLALLRLALGPNIAAEPLGELVIEPNRGEVKAVTTFRPPTLDPPPDLSNDSVRLILDLDVAFDRLAQQQRNRVDLSLQWLFRASETSGVTGFLMYWFALEALAMSGAQKLDDLHDRLAEIYQLDRNEVKARFRIGRLYGIRGDIVHQGLHPEIHTRVLDFMRSLYWDLLLRTLGLGAHQAAGRMLAAQDIDAWFPESRRRSHTR